MPSFHPQLAHFISHLQAALQDRFQRRSRKLTPATNIALLVCMIGFGRVGYRRVLNEFARQLHGLFGWDTPDDMPSAQCFGRSRRQLTPALCDQAFAVVRDRCQVALEDSVRRYAGLRLVAIDGTKLSLPPHPKLIEAFGVPRNQTGPHAAPMAGLVQLWDVGRNMPIAFALTPCDHDERAQAVSLFQNLDHNDLLIGDRGYPSYALFRALARRRCRFLLRCSKKQCTEVIDFLASGEQDAIVRLISRDHKGRRVEGTPAIPVRLIRVPLPGGSVEVLATNLWAQRGHTVDALAALYTERWRIETAFREMKVFHALETFSATYSDGIYQEIAAIQIYLVLTAELEAMARRYHRAQTAERQTAEPDPAPQPDTPVENRSDDIRFNRLMIADTVVGILRAAADTPDKIAYVTEVSIKGIWRSRSSKRPNRQFPRMKKRPARGYRG